MSMLKRLHYYLLNLIHGDETHTTVILWTFSLQARATGNRLSDDIMSSA